MKSRKKDQGQQCQWKSLNFKRAISNNKNWKVLELSIKYDTFILSVSAQAANSSRWVTSKMPPSFENAIEKSGNNASKTAMSIIKLE